MQHLEEISFILETIIQKICEIEPTENNIGSSYTTEECFDLNCEEKNSTNLNETNGALEMYDCDIVLNEEKSSSTSPKNNIFVINDSENIEKPFSLSEKLETTETSSGFEDLSITKYDENKSSSQGTERKSNETSDSKFTITVVNDVKSSEDFVIDKDENDEEKPRILTSTPKHDQENEKSFHFNSSDNLNDNSDDSSSTDFNEERENGEYLNVTIDEAIEKYEKADVEAKTKFKEVSVQTIIDQLLAVQCRCGLLNSKIDDEKTCVFSSQCPPSKKSKMEENRLKESDSSKVTEDRHEGLKPQNISSSHPELDRSSPKDSTATVIINNEEGSVCFKKIFPRIRIGLSKRAKPPPLHNKLIY